VVVVVAVVVNKGHLTAARRGSQQPGCHTRVSAARRAGRSETGPPGRAVRELPLLSS